MSNVSPIEGFMTPAQVAGQTRQRGKSVQDKGCLIVEDSWYDYETGGTSVNRIYLWTENRGREMKKMLLEALARMEGLTCHGIDESRAIVIDVFLQAHAGDDPDRSASIGFVYDKTDAFEITYEMHGDEISYWEEGVFYNFDSDTFYLYVEDGEAGQM